MSRHVAVIGGAFLGGVKPRGLGIYHRVDRSCPKWTGSFMEKTTFTRMCLSSIRVIMAIMRVLIME
jgi:hypothetical protein